MAEGDIHREGIARLARELAHSGKCRTIVEIEAALILQGHDTTDLQEPVLRAELELLIEDAHKPSL